MIEEERTTRGARVAQRASLAILLALPACIAEQVRTSGNEPVGNVRIPLNSRDIAARERAEAKRDAADSAAARAAEQQAPVPTTVIGTTRAREYHRAGCPRLSASPASDLVQLRSPYAAIDAGYAPCPHCRPGP